MRVVVLVSGQSNQVALVNKLATKVEVSAVVTSDNIPRRRPTWKKRLRLSLNAVAARTVGKELASVWLEMLAEYRAAHSKFNVDNVIGVSNVNHEITIKTIESISPDLVVVSGTNLVGKRLIESASTCGKIMNLHTGLSPYVRGGPNCTNWCLAKGWFHLIGNTVMWLDAGIDTGNIIATELTPLTGNESLLELHWKVMEHAHEMYVGSVAKFVEGHILPNIAQKAVATGSHFDSVDWGVLEMRRAIANFHAGFRDFYCDERVTDEIPTVFPILNA